MHLVTFFTNNEPHKSFKVVIWKGEREKRMQNEEKESIDSM